jgi:glycosyltransferase involved in cell wall biosynthesis/SAM-dependent methyltransferase
MRISFHSPLPPCDSGIADYSAALIEALGSYATVETGTEPARADIALYQIGNNPHHIDAYDLALAHPGVVVLHEANLHHLMAERTIRRGDWDGYLRELVYDGGEAAAAYGQRVRALEVGPDYAGVPMLRRLLERTRGLIVHSQYVEQRAREAGYTGPVAVIPHGAWLPVMDDSAERERLGIRGAEPLVGIFGHLKPYKRILQSLRAFARLTRENRDAKLVLAGAEHPDLPLEPLLAQLGLNGNVRRLGVLDGERFNGAMAACDIGLNLRYPTVGETSGTLMRALGMGKAVVVSDAGAFAELPADVCLRVPVEGDEEELLYQYLKLLCGRADLRQALGTRAREWVAAECNWNRVAERYADFLRQVAARPRRIETLGAKPVVADDLLQWAQPGAEAYLRSHLARLLKTLEMTPRGTAKDSVLEMGAYLQITPLLARRLGYGEVRGSYLGQAGQVDHKRVVSSHGDLFECSIDLFDAERDAFPYAEGRFATVICGELLEHLAHDPMAMMSEINRILQPGGHLVLTTPNAASARAIAAALDGHHPGFFTTYMKPGPQGAAERRHSREYTVKEIYRLMVESGFEVLRMETGEFGEGAGHQYDWVRHLLAQRGQATDLRGDGTYVLAAKVGPVRERWPTWLYSE